MKKSTAAVAVVAALVLAYGGASWYVGKQAQTKIGQMVEEANQKLVTALGPNFSGEDLQISTLEYQRGIFSSDVTTALRLRGSDGEIIELLLQDNLQHGPFPMAALAEGKFKPMLAYSHSKLVPTETLKPWFDAAKGEPMEVRTSIGLGGEGVSEWRFAPVELAKDDARVNFSGAELNLRFFSNWEEGQANGGFALLNVQDDTGQLQISDLSLSGNARRNADDVLQSESKVKIAGLKVAGSGLADVEFSDLNVELNSEQQGNIIDGDLSYGFGSIKALGMELGSVNLRLSASGLDAQVLSELAVLLEQSDADDFDPSTEELNRLQAKLTELLKNKPSVALDPLSWKNDAGESRLVLKADLQEAKAEQQSAMGDELKYLNKAELDFKLSRDMFIRLFSQTQGQGSSGMEAFGSMLFDQYSARLHGAGLVTQEEGDLLIKATYADGNIVLNGQAMPVEEFIQRAMLAAM